MQEKGILQVGEKYNIWRTKLFIKTDFRLGELHRELTEHSGIYVVPVLYH